jgi:hypothetical protein
MYDRSHAYGPRPDRGRAGAPVKTYSNQKSLTHLNIDVTSDRLTRHRRQSSRHFALSLCVAMHRIPRLIGLRRIAIPPPSPQPLPARWQALQSNAASRASAIYAFDGQSNAGLHLPQDQNGLCSITAPPIIKHCLRCGYRDRVSPPLYCIHRLPGA